MFQSHSYRQSDLQRFLKEILVKASASNMLLLCVAVCVCVCVDMEGGYESQLQIRCGLLCTRCYHHLLLLFTQKRETMLNKKRRNTKIYHMHMHTDTWWSVLSGYGDKLLYDVEFAYYDAGSWSCNYLTIRMENCPLALEEQKRRHHLRSSNKEGEEG